MGIWNPYKFLVSLFLVDIYHFSIVLLIFCLTIYRSTLHHFDEGNGGLNERIPFFRADITLAIPNVVCIFSFIAERTTWATP